VYEVRLIFQD